MGNHVHLLIKTGEEELNQVFKRLGTRYVYWYNWKYNRTGHLFQDRFKSEPVEDDSYFLTVLRYIHQNPVRAHLTNNINAYKWSSYHEYIEKPQLTDTSFALKMMPLNELISYHNEEANDKCLEIKRNVPKLNDIESKNLMTKLFNFNTIEQFQSLDTPTRNDCIRKLKQEGMSIRQISRLTGISKGVVEKL
jgi:hypothetical protein